MARHMRTNTRPCLYSHNGTGSSFSASCVLMRTSDHRPSLIGPGILVFIRIAWEGRNIPLNVSILVHTGKILREYASIVAHAPAAFGDPSARGRYEDGREWVTSTGNTRGTPQPDILLARGAVIDEKHLVTTQKLGRTPHGSTGWGRVRVL
ncbi:hypothetical protein L209DRAFT_749949 [Thermothelomyces heterothallicus CBS 203.75]